MLVFSASTGGGHNAAARTVIDGLEKLGYCAELVDAFGDTSKTFNKMLTRGYRDMVECTPKLYDLFYNDLNRDSFRRRGIFGIAALRMRHDIVAIIKTASPELIISTHPFVTNILGRIKEKQGFTIPILSFVTDYKFHGVYNHPMINAYVVGSSYTKEGMVRRGVDPNIIYPYGIPVKRGFKHKDRQNRQHKKVAGTFLLMGGTLGDRHMKKAFMTLLNVRHPIKIIAVCGNNKRLYCTLNRYVKRTLHPGKIVEIHGFVNNVSDLMDASDLIVSKPGGMTTTEAVVKGIPMVVPYYYPGQEEENADYVAKMGMGIVCHDMDDLALVVDYLIENKNIVKQMSENMNKEASGFSLDATLDLCEHLIDTHKNR